MIEILETMFADFGPMVNLEIYVAIVVILVIISAIVVVKESR